MGRCLLDDGSERNSIWGDDLGRRRLCGTPVVVAKSGFLPRSADLQFIDSSAHPAGMEGFRISTHRYVSNHFDHRPESPRYR